MAVKCSNCIICPLCFPRDMFIGNTFQVDQYISGKLSLNKGQSLYQDKTPANHLYIVRRGSLKTIAALPDCRHRVMGFHFAGDWLGFDGIGNDAHHLSAIALESCEICTISIKNLEFSALFHPLLQTEIHRKFSRKIIQTKRHLLTLGNSRSEEKLTNFLLNLSLRLLLRGHRHDDFILPMTKSDIANYLGIDIATLSRLFSQTSLQGLLQVKYRHIRILDPVKLSRYSR